MKISPSEIPKVILASKDSSEIPSVAERVRPTWVFLLGGAAGTVMGASKLLGSRGFTVFVHIDMVHGLSKDPEGIRLLKTFAQPAGIISTHPSIVTAAHKAGLATIERIFLLDSSSVESGIKNIERSQPDAVEVLPGILPRQISAIASQLSVPLIAGGLITTPDQVFDALRSGAHGISTSSEELVLEFEALASHRRRIGVMAEDEKV